MERLPRRIAALFVATTCALCFASCRHLLVPSTYEVTVEAKSKRTWSETPLTSHRYVLSASGERGFAIHVVQCGGRALKRQSVALDREQLEALWRALEQHQAWSLPNDYSGAGEWRWKVTLYEGGDRHMFELTGEAPTDQWEIVRLIETAARVDTPPPERCDPPAD